MLRSDVLWRNGGRLLSVALLGGLALNAAGAPIDTMDAHGSQRASQSWLSLQDGWLCRSWSASLAASTASIPPVVMSPSADAVPLTLTTQSQHSISADAARGGLAFDTMTLGQRTHQGTHQGVTHCSTLWHISADGRLVSDAPSWVPNPTGEWPAPADRIFTAKPLRAMSLNMALAGTPRQTATASHTIASVLVLHKIAPKPAPIADTSASRAGTFYSAGGGIGPWTPVPGHPTYAMSDFAGDPYSYEFGVCTWWAWYARRDEPQLGTLGVATNWISAAQARGMSVGYTPAVGATVVFQPGVQGAGGSGHVGHVEQLVGGGWFIISEMNFYWNGGGWGRVDYRYAHAGSGVEFIY
ncbi:MAG TPA: CHAP domain-containing protein [Ktedonobacterales bacterium]